MTTLLDALADIFPNVGPIWRGCYGTDTAETVWQDHRILVDSDTFGNGQTYDVGIYNADDEAPVLFVALPLDPLAVAAYLDHITENPEGTDWLAWAAQWTADAIADGRLDAELIEPQ